MLSFLVAFLSVAVSTYDDMKKSGDTNDDSAARSTINSNSGYEPANADKNSIPENSAPDENSMTSAGIENETVYMSEIMEMTFSPGIFI